MQAIGITSNVVGDLSLLAHDGAIVALQWHKPSARLDRPAGDQATRSVLKEAAAQMQAYFAGRLDRFDLPLAPRGTEFQQRVYQALLDIPFGQTRSYGELASSLGSAAQPVGQACGSNPIAILIPCHRVLARRGAGGFSAPNGIEAKMALLKHENAWPYLL